MNVKMMLGLMAAAMISLSGASAEKASAAPGEILIAYYSWSGNTRFAAEQIQKFTGGTLFESERVPGVRRSGKKGVPFRIPAGPCGECSRYGKIQSCVCRLSELVQHDRSAGPLLPLRIRFQREDRDPLCDPWKRRNGKLRNRSAESVSESLLRKGRRFSRFRDSKCRSRPGTVGSGSDCCSEVICGGITCIPSAAEMKRRDGRSRKVRENHRFGRKSGWPPQPSENQSK